MYINGTLHNVTYFLFPPRPLLALGLLTSIPSLILYTIEALFVILARRHHFKSSFFLLFLAQFISNTLNCLSTFPFVRLLRVGIGLPIVNQLPERLPSIVLFVYYWSFCASAMLMIAILSNRLTAILLPLKHDRIWNSALPLSLIFSYAVPILFASPTLKNIYHLYVTNHGLTYTIKFAPYVGNRISSIRSATFFMVSSFFACSGLNCATLAVCRRHLRNATSANRLRMEFRLTVYAVVTCTAQLLVLIVQLFFYVAIEFGLRGPLSTWEHRAWVTDICNVVAPSWMMLWACMEMRAAVISQFRRCLWRDWREKSGDSGSGAITTCMSRITGITAATTSSLHSNWDGGQKRFTWKR